MISVDSFGWIERLTNGPKASKYNKVIDTNKPNDLITSVVVLYEVYKKVKSLKDEETALQVISFLNQTNVVPIDQTLSLEAADYSLEHKLHFSDALVYATARHYFAELHTSDEDLKGLRGVTFI